MRPLVLALSLSSALVVPPPASAQSLGPYARGVPGGVATAEPLSLTMLDAVQRALDHNLGRLVAEQRVFEAEGARWKALGDLLPNVGGRLSASREKVNLEAFGFPLPPGIPPVVGPFNVFDLRVLLTQSVYDIHAIYTNRAEQRNLDAARFDMKNARDLVVLVSANAYSQALAASAREDASRAQLETAQTLHRQALDLKQAGMIAGIDVVRADVQVSMARQRLTAARTDFEKIKLQLARIAGLPLGQAFTLKDQIRSVPFPDMTIEQAVERAYQSRGDYKAALARVEAAEASLRAARGEQLPSVRLTADYGDIGLTLGQAHVSYNVTGAINVPIFSGRTKGHVQEADAELRGRRNEAEDLKAAVYYEVRAAFLDLQSGREQLDVASRASALAADQLAQARDRFAAGVAGNIEVVQAQEAVALAADQVIAAMFTSNLATGNLIGALGIAEDAVRQYLGEVR